MTRCYRRGQGVQTDTAQARRQLLVLALAPLALLVRSVGLIVRRSTEDRWLAAV